MNEPTNPAIARASVFVQFAYQIMLIVGIAVTVIVFVVSRPSTVEVQTIVNRAVIQMQESQDIKIQNLTNGQADMKNDLHELRTIFERYLNSKLR